MTLPELPERPFRDNPHGSPLCLFAQGARCPKSQPFQVLRDGRVQPLRLGLLLPPLGSEALPESCLVAVLTRPSGSALWG